LSNLIDTPDYKGEDRRNGDNAKWLHISLEFLVQMVTLLFLAGMTYQRLQSLETKVSSNESAMIQYERRDVLDAKLEAIQTEIVSNRNESAERLEEIKQQLTALRSELHRR
jgi:hypothetical protein